MDSNPHRFDSHLELARLPYFELNERRRLVLADPSFGPIIDIHTHLALTYLRRRTVDLLAAPGPAEHYLPLERGIDLEIYANKNFSDSDLARLKKDLSLRSVTSGGMRRTHTIPNLESEMEELGIATSVLLPIDFPFFSHNAESWLAASTGRERLRCLGSVHSHARDVGEKLEAQKRLGARGVKVHPAVQGVRPDHPKCMALYRTAGELDLPIMWHCGPVDIETRHGRECSQLKHYWPAIRENPHTTFILGHSGALQPEQALDLAKLYPNVHLDLSCQSLPVTRRIVEEAPIERVMFGSDWPFYHQAFGLAKVLLATEGRPAERKLVLFENAARFYGLAESGS